MADDHTEDVGTSGQEQTSSLPWEKDLAERFEDESVREQVSAFLGETVQPYVTRIEQEARPSRDATRLWEGFNENPVETYVQVSRELYGPEVAERVAAILQGESPEEHEPSESTPPAPSEEEQETQGVSFDDLPVEVKEAVARQQAEEQRQAYYSEIERVKTENAETLPKDEEGNPRLNVDLFHPFVVAADGDFDAAFEAYTEFYSQAKNEFGIQVPSGEEVEVPPATINSETRDAGETPPQEVKYDSLEDAMDAFFDEQNAPPPTVGTA